MNETRDFTVGLASLSTPETRVRLGEVLAACRTRACEIAGFQGQGLADEASSAERKLRLAVQEQIRHLDQCLRVYGTPMPGDEMAPVAAAEPTPEPEVAPAPVEAAPPEPEPDPVPAYLPPARGTRPTLPLRPLRVPPQRPA